MGTEHLLPLFLSLVIGSFIGLEREINGKVAGFRTMALICVGSAILTMISIQIGGDGSKDRIAANILTGIGFIGAGVVFKDGLNVSGITTAATIWMTAALGMCVGCENYSLALEGMAVTLVVLFFFEKILNVLTRQKEHRSYVIHFKKENTSHEIYAKLNKLKVRCLKKIESKDETKIKLSINLFGNKEKMEVFNHYLLESENVKSFDSFL